MEAPQPLKISYCIAQQHLREYLDKITTVLPAYYFHEDGWAITGDFDYPGTFIGEKYKFLVHNCYLKGNHLRCILDSRPQSFALPTLSLNRLHNTQRKPTGAQGKSTKVNKKYVDHPYCTVTMWSLVAHPECVLLDVKPATSEKKRRKEPLNRENDNISPPQPVAMPLPAIIHAIVPRPRVMDPPPPPPPPPDRLLPCLINEGNTGAVRKLLHCNRDLVHVRVYHGYTLLHNACRAKQLGIVILLIEEFGMPVDIRVDNGSTPLHQAAHRGNVGILQYLLRKGAMPDFRTGPGGYLPVHNASMQGHGKAVDLLLAAYCDDSVFEQPSKHCSMELMKEWRALRGSAPSSPLIPPSLPGLVGIDDLLADLSTTS